MMIISRFDVNIGLFWIGWDWTSLVGTHVLRWTPLDEVLLVSLTREGFPQRSTVRNQGEIAKVAN